MRERAIIHIAGSKGAGKTTLIELLLRGFGGFALAARCVLDRKLKKSNETAPRNHPELRRYLEAGASGAALFRFPADEIESDAFFTTDLMNDYSHAIIIEGDNPVAFAGVEVYVASPLTPETHLLIRQNRDRAREDREKANALETQLLRHPESITELFGQIVGAPLAEAMKRSPKLMEKTRTELLDGLAKLREGPQPKPSEHWAIAADYAGIERAQLVVINIRRDQNREGARRLLLELERLRKDKVVFDEVLGWRGKKTPVTAAIADLSDPKDAGAKKAVSRIRRKMKLQPREDIYCALK